MEASAASAPAGLSRPSVSAPLLRLRSDEQLVAQFRAGNDDAFGVIHDRYRARLGTYARRMLSGSQADAEDVLQDVFLRAYRALRADQRPLSLRAWLYRVAHNRCIDQVRRPVPVAADIVDTSRTPGHDPCAETEQREDLRRLVADLRRLPDQQRSALLMREIDGISYSELAEALDVSVPAVKSLLVRARLGLVDAAVARDTDCDAIRHDLADAHERGVRASGRARRHLRECSGCSSYRRQLSGVRRGLAALSPAAGSPLLLGKLLGIGGVGTGAAGAAAGGGGAALAGGGAVAGIAKVAAIVCCAAAVTGGAIEVRHAATTTRTPAPARSAATIAPATTAAAVTPPQWVVGASRTDAGAATETMDAAAATLSGGALAPAATAPATVPAPDVVVPAAAPLPAVAAPSDATVGEATSTAEDAAASAEADTPVGAADAGEAGATEVGAAQAEVAVAPPADAAPSSPDDEAAAIDPATPRPAHDDGNEPVSAPSSPEPVS